MVGDYSIYPEPGALVTRFSWELEARQRTESETAETAEYDQLRSDFVAEQERRQRERNKEINRIEEMFSAKR